MKYWLIVFALVYLFALIYSAYKSKKSIVKSKDYSLPQIGAFLGFLTFSATLFSTFTLMGMPDFFRMHGVGAWIFLGVTDTALAFVLLWFGVYLRKKYSKNNFTNVSTIIRERYKGNFAVYIYRIGIFVFLIPYIAIQIKGISEFIEYSQVLNIPAWIWASVFLIIILIYSFLGGLKAIIVSDAIQGLILLVVTLLIAFTCVKNLGGVNAMFSEISVSNSQLLSIPGPKGLLTSQFLLSSFVVIVLMPVSQPQLLTRIVIMNNIGGVKRMAVAVSVFAFLIILPTIFIGFYGAVKFPEANTQEFLYQTLIKDQYSIVGALALIGLIAAAMSTADSQLFAMQTEIVKNTGSKKINKLFMLFFGLIALLLSIFSTQELVLLARVSFAGTALLAPMIFISLFSKYKHCNLLPFITLGALIVYLIGNLTIFIPAKILFLRLDIFLLIINTLSALFVYIYKRNLSENMQ